MVRSRSGLVLATLLVAIAGCGPSAPAGSPADGEHHGEEHGEHEHHHGAMPAPVHDFHEVLAPLWHGEKGPERVTKTCAQATAMHDKAAAIESAPVPEHADEAGWRADAAALVAATRALAAECEKEGRPDFEARFGTLHEDFEKLAGRLGH